MSAAVMTGPGTVASGSDIRPGVVAMAWRDIAAGRIDTPEKLKVAVDMMIADAQSALVPGSNSVQRLRPQHGPTCVGCSVPKTRSGERYMCFNPTCVVNTHHSSCSSAD